MESLGDFEEELFDNSNSEIDEFRSCYAIDEEEEVEEVWEDTDESFAHVSKELLDEFSVKLFFKGVSICEEKEDGSKVAGIGVVMEKGGGNEVAVIEVKKKMDFYVEELVAEHLALLDGILVALKNDVKKIYAFTDSEKLYFQIAETELLEDNLLVALGHRILELAEQLDDFDLTLVPNLDLEKPLQLAQDAIGIYNPPIVSSVSSREQGDRYCPYPSCSARIDPVQSYCGSGTSDAYRVECPECRRDYCFNCLVPWHAMLTCEEYWDLLSDDRDGGILSTRNLARLDRWRTCQQCGNRVEPTPGCNRMACWCGHEFCYSCGAEYLHGNQTCQCSTYWAHSQHDTADLQSNPPHQMEMWSWDSFDCIPTNTMEGYSEQERAQLQLIQRFLSGGFSLSDHPCQDPAPPRCSESYIDTMKDLHQLPWLERFVSVISDSYNEEYIQ
ncbi:RING/U-box superfamily protein [Rhynchospora pubera]|uniref:RBR-type E3 ubiquitin transferase n=1 Tax=Rhynchospora pubera TaxID=906938 RepID=A0AAV8ES64_9POAL|nr:RING/U-box superfamily protein [Rhynchospora pubera]